MNLIDWKKQYHETRMPDQLKSKITQTITNTEPHSVQSSRKIRSRRMQSPGVVAAGFFVVIGGALTYLSTNSKHNNSGTGNVQNQRSLSTNNSISSSRSVVTVTGYMQSAGIPGLQVLSSHLDVSVGQNASITIKTKPGTKSSIEVDYSSGPSGDSDLHAQTADSNGDVTWIWKVPSDTTPGNWNVTITAGDESIMVQLNVSK